MDRILSLYISEATYTLLLALIFFCVTYLLFRRKSKQLPPGPGGLPIVGNLLFFSKNPHLKLLELRKKYGPIYSIKVGSNTMVALCDYQSIRCALLQDAFTGIPPNVQNGSEYVSDTHDAAQTAQEWTEQRRFCIHLLKDLGFGRSKMEEYVKEEICYVLDVLKENVGQPQMMESVLNPSVSNNIASLMFGRRMDYDDPKRIFLDQIFKDFNKFSGQLAIAAFFPWIMPIMRWLRIGSLHKLADINTKLKEFFENEIEEHERTLDSENIRDFIDGFLVEMKKREGQPNTKFTKNVLQEMALGFFAAGTDTIKYTIDWLLLTVAAFKDVQERVQKEIDEVIGAARFPMYKDRSKMPFTQAVIMEIMRWRNVFPINYFKYTTKDAEVNSVFIPKHTYVLVNTWSLSHDPVLWSHPDSFRPERFLTSDRKSIRKPEYFIPFSTVLCVPNSEMVGMYMKVRSTCEMFSHAMMLISVTDYHFSRCSNLLISGKRVCPGESFASIEVFLYFAAILQKFRINPPEGTVIDLEGNLALSLQPKPQNIVFTLRD